MSQVEGMPRPATLQDVADRAGVHRSTVALALRDHPRISEATRANVKAIATRLGYRINPFVAALMKSRRSGRAVRHATIGFVTNYPTRFGWRPPHHDRPDYFPGAAERARELGYKLDHFWLAEPGMTSRRFCDILTARGVNGLIIGRMPPGQNALELAWDRFSCVAFGMTLRSPCLHHVTENHFDTACQGMQKCLERGYRRVGFVYSEANDSPLVGERWAGAYFSRQLKFPLRDRLKLCPGEPTDRDTFAAWLHRQKPDALLVTHALPVVEWLKTMGLEVPRDIGLVELQDDPQRGSTGVYYDPARIGALAVEILLGMMHHNETGVPTDQHEVLLTGEWREGTTLPSRLGQI